jgi:hypothetical protein
VFDGGNADDCAGVCGGDSWASDCGCVAADNSGDDCDDCAGTPNGDTVIDECGECGGDGSSCQGVTVEIPFASGQTWFSLNVITSDDMNVTSVFGSPQNEDGTGVKYIKGQLGYTQYYESLDIWLPDLDLDVTQGYKATSDASSTLTLTGDPVDVA